MSVTINLEQLTAATLKWRHHWRHLGAARTVSAIKNPGASIPILLTWPINIDLLIALRLFVSSQNLFVRREVWWFVIRWLCRCLRLAVFAPYSSIQWCLSEVCLVHDDFKYVRKSVSMEIRLYSQISIV